MRERHNDRLCLEIEDNDNWMKWLEYWQALRDIPQKEDFNSQYVVFPEKPE